MQPRMLIVDDHPLTRDGLAALLADHGFEIVGEASGGHEAIERARELQPDVVLLDLSMPDLDGLSALPLLRTAAPECEVVVLTASGDEENLLSAIRGGAAGYLLKTEPPERLVDFLHGAAAGEAAPSGVVARRLLDQVRNGRPSDGGVPEAIARRYSGQPSPPATLPRVRAVALSPELTERPAEEAGRFAFRRRIPRPPRRRGGAEARGCNHPP